MREVGNEATSLCDTETSVSRPRLCMTATLNHGCAYLGRLAPHCLLQYVHPVLGIAFSVIGVRAA